MKVNGVVLWEGPSELDGGPIVVIATGLASRSPNVKTGAMVQTYILRRDVSPIVAIKENADASICGACPHRGEGGGKGRTCYVNVGQGPLAVWRAYRAGRYPHTGPQNWRALFSGRKIRFGTYGDPAAVKAWLWSALSQHASGWTGYTHQWRGRSDLRPYCMASVDTATEAAQAQGDGWRTFRVAAPGAVERIQSEVLCPASELAGKRLQCADCLACCGGNRRGSIMIPAHGGFAVMSAVKRRGIGLELAA